MKKRLIALFLVLAMTFALAIPAIATPTPVAGQPKWDSKYSTVAESNQLVGVYYDRGNASGDKISSNAHSGDFPGVYFRWDDKQKMPGVFLVEDWVFDLFVNETFYLTAKNSNSYYKYTINRDTGSLKDGVYVYGIPKEVMAKDNKGNDKKDELKNINMVFIDGTYKSAWVLLTKVWVDENGFPVIGDWAALNKELKFSNGFKLGLNEKDFNEIKITDFTTAVKGKKISITETAMPAGFAFKDARILSGVGKNIAGGVELTLKPGDCAAVNFTNQKLWSKLEIVKVWKDADGNCISGAELEARFTVYTLEWTLFGKTFYVPVVDKNGKKLENVDPGVYEISSTIYNLLNVKVAEVKCSEGYELDSIFVNGSEVNGPYAAVPKFTPGKTETVKFVNKDPKVTPEGKFGLDKMVIDENGDKVGIVEWMIGEGYYDETDGERFLSMEGMAILGDISFELYKSNEAGDKLSKVNAESDFDVMKGYISFSLKEEDSISGWFVVKEILGEKAKELFVDGKELLIYVTFDADGNGTVSDSLGGMIGGGSTSTGGTDFDKDATYHIVLSGDGYFSNTERFANAALEIQPFNMSDYVNEYKSYCAWKEAVGVCGHGYVVADMPDDVNYDALLAAFNYAEKNFGESRVIRQVLSWYYFADLDLETLGNDAWWTIPQGLVAVSDNVRMINDEEIKAIKDTVAAVEDGYAEKGPIVEIVYLVCSEDHDKDECQPQIVPIYSGGITFDNEPNTVTPAGKAAFTKVKYDGDFAQYDPLFVVAVYEFAFDLYKKDTTGEWVLVTEADFVAPDKDYVWTGSRYYTELGGVVSVVNLTPGEYRFEEVIGYALTGKEPAWHPEGLGNGWGFVWGPKDSDDGIVLYFTIPETGGKAVWADGYTLDDAGEPIVNNVLLCKHNIMWTAWDNFDGKCEPNENGAGFLVYNRDHVYGEDGTLVNDRGYLMATYIPATCTKPAAISLVCSHEGTAFGTGFDVGVALGHNEAKQAIILRDGLPVAIISIDCARCGDHVKDDNDIKLWEELTGRCYVCWLDGLDGYCVCDDGNEGYTCENCGEPVELDEFGWYECDECEWIGYYDID